MNCKRCQTRKAQTPAASVFILCAACADAVFPGPDVQKYMELHRLYGR